MEYDVRLERMDVAIRAVMALYRKPRQGNSWALLAELGLSRSDEEALQYLSDIEAPLRSDEDVALALELCPNLLPAAVTLLGRYTEVSGSSRTQFYARNRGKRVA